MKISIIAPTYQERDNIKPLIERISTVLAELDYEIIVVDDSSPDGTAELAASMANDYPVIVIKREGIRGLGSAILEGFRNARGDIIGVIDTDLQHPPEVLTTLINTIQNGADIAVASRYIPGGGVEEWPFIRRMISKIATLLARPLTKVKDPMSGYFMLNKEVVKDRNFSPKGYKILLEILVKGNYRQAKEIPYIFQNRTTGSSKLGFSEYISYLKLLLSLYYIKIKKTIIST